MKDVRKSIEDSGNDLSKSISEEFDPNFIETNIRRIVDSRREFTNNTLKSMRDSAELTNKQYTQAKNFLNESLRVIEKQLDKGNALTTVRNVKIGLGKKLSKADYLPGGTKSGAARDNVKLVESVVRDIEDDIAEAFAGMPDQVAFDGGGIFRASNSKLDAFRESLANYRHLKVLEDELSKIPDMNSVSNFDILSGVGAAALGGDLGLLGGTLLTGKKVYELARKPTGRLILARLVEKGDEVPHALAKAAAKMFGGTTEDWLTSGPRLARSIQKMAASGAVEED